MSRKNSEKQSPHVAVCVDKSRSYGRGVLLGVADYLELMGHWSVYVDHFAVEQLNMEWIRRWKGDAILAYVPSVEAAKRLLRTNVPVVDVAGEIELPNLPCVRANDLSIGRLAGEHFLERDFRYFAYVGPGDCLPDNQRFQGFQECVGADDCHQHVYPRSPQKLLAWEREQKKLIRWIRNLPKPVGLMAFSDPIALQVLDACFRSEVSVPEEVAVIGVDNDEELCRLTHVPLSSVVSNPRRIGFEAAKMVSELIERKTAKKRPMRVLVEPLYVVTRRSTEVTAVDDLYVARSLAYIRQHSREPISVMDVARAVGLPRRSLYRRFAQALDRTPHDELLNVRLKQVRVLLAESEFTLDKVAALSGFNNASYLTTSFKREFGMTPGAYRSSCRNNAQNQK